MPLKRSYNRYIVTFIVLIGMGCHSHHEVQKTTPAPAQPKRESTTYNKLNKQSPTGVKNTSNSIEHKATYRTSAVMEKYAIKMGVSKGDLKNADLYALIDDWYSTPYKWGGRTKAGIDCSDFTEVVLEKIYGVIITGPASSIFKQCDIIPKSDLQEGDLVFFNISGPLSHVGVYLCNNKFVHASVRAGVIIEDLNMDYYKRYFYKAGRIKRS